MNNFIESARNIQKISLNKKMMFLISLNQIEAIHQICKAALECLEINLRTSMFHTVINLTLLILELLNFRQYLNKNLGQKILEVDEEIANNEQLDMILSKGDRSLSVIDEISYKNSNRLSEWKLKGRYTY